VPDLLVTDVTIVYQKVSKIMPEVWLSVMRQRSMPCTSGRLSLWTRIKMSVILLANCDMQNMTVCQVCQAGDISTIKCTDSARNGKNNLHANSTGIIISIHLLVQFSQDCVWAVGLNAVLELVLAVWGSSTQMSQSASIVDSEISCWLMQTQSIVI